MHWISCSPVSRVRSSQGKGPEGRTTFVPMVPATSRRVERSSGRKSKSADRGSTETPGPVTLRIARKEPSKHHNYLIFIFRSPWLIPNVWWAECKFPGCMSYFLDVHVCTSPPQVSFAGLNQAPGTSGGSQRATGRAVVRTVHDFATVDPGRPLFSASGAKSISQKLLKETHATFLNLVALLDIGFTFQPDMQGRSFFLFDLIHLLEIYFVGNRFNVNHRKVVLQRSQKSPWRQYLASDRRQDDLGSSTFKNRLLRFMNSKNRPV